MVHPDPGRRYRHRLRHPRLHRHPRHPRLHRIRRLRHPRPRLRRRRYQNLRQ